MFSDFLFKLEGLLQFLRKFRLTDKNFSFFSSIRRRSNYIDLLTLGNCPKDLARAKLAHCLRGYATIDILEVGVRKLRDFGGAYVFSLRRDDVF